MSELERRVALIARIDTLERHASVLEATFTTQTLKAETTKLMETLHRVKAILDAGATASPVLSEAEHLVDAASMLLASLGDVTCQSSLRS
jgi:hypothetical protein